MVAKTKSARTIRQYGKMRNSICSRNEDQQLQVLKNLIGDYGKEAAEMLKVLKEHGQTISVRNMAKDLEDAMP